MDWKKLADVHRAMAPEAFAHAFSDGGDPHTPGAAARDKAPVPPDAAVEGPAHTENKAEIRA